MQDTIISADFADRPGNSPALQSMEGHDDKRDGEGDGQPSKQQEELLPGSLIGDRYRVVEALASGGQGFVYLAIAEGAAGFSKPVVVKRTHTDLPPEERDSLAREARGLAQLRHPGIISVIDLLDDRGLYMVVLDFVLGFSLAKWLRFKMACGSPFDIDIALLIVLDVLAALEYAHAHGVVHRDVTPANVLIAVEGDVKLADFGIARTQQEVTDSSGDTVKGNFPYVAPEVFSGFDATAKSDVYSVGLVTYQLLIGNNPMRGKSLEDTVRRAMFDLPTPISQLRSEVSEALSEVIAKCYAKAADDRWQSAAELSTAIRSVHELDLVATRVRLNAAVARDFRDPQFSMIAKTHSIDRLERALEGKVSSSPPAITRPRHISGEHTVAAVPELPDVRRLPDEVAVPARSRTGWAAALVITLAAAGGLGWWSTRASEPETETFVVVSGRIEEPDPIARPELPQPVKLHMDASEAMQPSKMEPTRTPTRAERLTRTMRRRGGALRSCFGRHADVEGNPQITLRITVERDGTVGEATILPAELQGTGLGRCLEDVAKQTQFGTQLSRTTFRIPVTVSQ